MSIFAQYRHFEIQTLAPGVFAAINRPEGHAICNAAIIDLGDETLVFDTFLSPLAAEELRQAAQDLTQKPVRFVVNSHHHNDHVRGNAVFNGATFIATVKTAALIAKEEPALVESDRMEAPQAVAALQQALQHVSDESQRKEMNLGLHYNQAIVESVENYQPVIPTKTIQDSLFLSGSLNSVLLKTLGGGHTASDLFMWIPKHRILFAGDLVFNGFHPWLADGDIQQLDEIIRRLQSYQPKTVVPGHGSAGNDQLLQKMLIYNQEIRDRITEARASQLDDTAIDGMQPSITFQDWSLRNFYTTNIRLLEKIKR